MDSSQKKKIIFSLNLNYPQVVANLSVVLLLWAIEDILKNVGNLTVAGSHWIL